MYLEVDYMDKYDEDLEEMKNSPSRLTPEEQQEELQHIIEVGELMCAERQKVPSEKKKEMIMAIFSSFKYQAFIQGGKVALNLDEETLYARLTYTGKMLCKTGTKEDTLGMLMSILYNEGSTVFLTAKEECFVLDASFEMFEWEQVADNSKEIEAKRLAFKEKWMNKKKNQ